jgi:hypothetical protein
MVSRQHFVSLLSATQEAGDVLTCLALGAVLLTSAGCSDAQSANQRFAKELQQTGQSERSVVRFAGKVLVDGQPAHAAVAKQKVLVILFDQAQPKLQVGQRPVAWCNERGEFSFTTYRAGDGVEPGEYVVAIAQLMQHTKDDSFDGPDGLKNLYNDPDKNREVSEFKIKHASPGKTDYVFDLKLAGQDPVAAPGPHAVTEIPND